MKFFAIYRDGQLIPSGKGSVEEFAKLKNNHQYLIEAKKPRNIAFHRKYFGLLQAVMAVTNYDDLDLLRQDVSIAAGWVHKRKFMGYEVVTPKSISFANMDGIEFEAFYNKAWETIISEFVKDISEEEFNRIVETFA